MKKKKKFIIIALILAIAAYTAVVFLLKEKQANSKIIKVSGNIEGDDVRISFRITGQIIELLTDEGKVIRKGDIVARLNKDELSKVQAEAEAALKLAEYQYKLDYDDYVRAENLLKAGAISAQQRDTAKTRMNTDSANIKQLRASLELANTKLGWADLASPLDGYVLVKSALPGEVVQPGSPVFTAVNLDDLWVTAYINETDLGKVKLGQKAYAETDTYRGKKYSGRVSFISSQTEFTPKYIQTNEERVKYVYRIKVRVDNSSLDLKPGMPADAYIMIE
ncbi:MAG: efflux RND transporter periplasmic adaptor subunit [Candidatus Omnitrophota bacterium]|jgi:HlyD family secretion protein|nr:efflux RND transporter periplasmic adaptor subunit [Candidatus Omnitrophota bacterium]MDD5518634.1 efflux RND transporter periplasmic adaptor subunit [Candidatus Omnitrophota bacterium]